MVKTQLNEKQKNSAQIGSCEADSTTKDGNKAEVTGKKKRNSVKLPRQISKRIPMLK